MSVSSGLSTQLRLSDVLARVLFTNNYVAICTGEIPQNNWPDIAGPTPWDQYDSLQELCVGDWRFFFVSDSIQAHFPPSLWCRCPYDMSSGIFCDSPFRSSAVAESLNLVEYCYQKCSCSRDGLSPAAKALEKKAQAPPLLSSPSRRKKANRRAQKANRQTAAFFSREGEKKTSASKGKFGSKASECPNLQGCNNFDSCSTQRLIPGCENIVCKVLERSPGKFFGLGSCFIPLTSNEKIGERSITLDACPCNQSYVSTACCTASDGYVYETGLKLGELVEV